MKYLLLCAISTVCFVSDIHPQEDAFAYYCPPCNSECDEIAFENEGKCSHCNMRLLKQTADQHEMAMNIRNMTIGFYLQDGVEVLDFAGPMEVFSYAGFNVIIIARTKNPIKSQGILTIIPDYSIENAPTVDILAFFGGGGAGPASKDKAVIQWIRDQKSVEYYFSVCTGAFFLGEAGILDGLQATTFHSQIDALRERFPKTKVLPDVRYVDNGTVITTAGISAGIDGALHFVQKFAGEEAAQRIAENMEYDKWKPNEGVVVK